MIRRTLLSLTLALSFAGYAMAQGQDGNPPNAQDSQGDQPTVAEELQRQIAALQKRVTDLETKIAALPDLSQKLDTIASQLKAIDADAIQALGDEVRELSVAMSQIATQSGDGYNVDILGKMSTSANFREELRRATQGRIVFNNFTTLPQLVYINGTAWNVQPGQTYIDAAVGTVSAQMAYFELAPKTYDHWKFEGGQYQMVIDIR
ncbi:MAG: DUF2730 domain-containing protein [Pirellulales bacterium]|nr:DUF2730 domain-containing protein [Pirellulales bacterium]